MNDEWRNINVQQKRYQRRCTMKCCPICNGAISEDKKFLFLGEKGETWYICESCERKLYLVTDGTRKRWVHLAIVDLVANLQQNQDTELKRVLNKLIVHRIRKVGMHTPHL